MPKALSAVVVGFDSEEDLEQSRPATPVVEDGRPSVDEGRPQDAARKTTTSWMSKEPQDPPTADMIGSRSGLGKIAGRFYPIGSVRQFLHPSCLCVVFVTCLGYSANVFIPGIDAFWAGMSWNLAYLAIQGTTGAFLLVVCGGPRWAYFPFLVLILALMNVSFHFAGTSLFGATLAYISFAAFTCKWQKRPTILFGILAWMFAFQITLLLVLLFIEPIQSKCGGNEMCKGLVLPVCSWVYSTVGLILMKRTVQSCAPVGTPLVSISAFIALLVASSEELKLASLVQSATEDTDEGGIKMLATAALTSFVGDFAKRVLLPQRCQNLVLRAIGIKYQFTVSPEMDVVLRAGYTVSYYPAIPALLFSLVGLAAGAPWASRWIYWAAMACFVLTDLVADFLLVTIHRCFYPVLDETPRQTWASLMDPRQHWPTMQMEGYKRSKHSRRLTPSIKEEDLQETWSRHSWLNDTMICCLCFSALTTMTTKFAMASVLSRCRLDVAAHLCSAFEGA